MTRRPSLVGTIAALPLLFAIDYAARALGVPRDAAAWVGFGVLIAGVALVRPGWVRDRPGAVPLALALAAAFLFLGLCTDVRFSRRGARGARTGGTRANAGTVTMHVDAIAAIAALLEAVRDGAELDKVRHPQRDPPRWRSTS